MAIQRRSFLKSLPALTGLSLLADRMHAKPTGSGLRIIVASDGHFGQPDTNFIDFHNDLIGWINRERFQKGVDFVIFNGDLVHDDPTLYYDLKKTLSNLHVPFYVTRGNHDKVSLDVWESTWGYPTNHSFVKGDYAFILGDTSNENGEYLCPDPVWLKKELDTHADKTGIFVFLHITPAKWTTYGISCTEVMDMLENTPNIKGIFHGHDHDQDGVKMLKKKPFFFDGHFGGNWGTTYKGYRVIEINEDDSWTSYQYNPTAAPVLNTFSGKM